ncbi:hypothetical protein CSOJ01_05991 [Colletotrichum sojae]|uniref:Uncharacterized protein n=1 Tax=Colletotrichum sojae TaxID=2175907 RepID=A0A8H6MW11_9PEZI|nr:hypothetical protein CSOJ01_05991 [Colletotrichum sojae]
MSSIRGPRAPQTTVTCGLPSPAPVPAAAPGGVDTPDGGWHLVRASSETCAAANTEYIHTLYLLVATREDSNNVGNASQPGLDACCDRTGSTSPTKPSQQTTYLDQTRPAPSPGNNTTGQACLPSACHARPRTEGLVAAGLVVTVPAADRRGHYWHWLSSPAPATQPSLAACAPRSTSPRRRGPGDLMFPMLLSPPHRGDDPRPAISSNATTTPQCYDAFNARSNPGAWPDGGAWRYAVDVRNSLAATQYTGRTQDAACDNARRNGFFLTDSNHVAWWSDGAPDLRLSRSPPLFEKQQRCSSDDVQTLHPALFSGGGGGVDPTCPVPTPSGAVLDGDSCHLPALGRLQFLRPGGLLETPHADGSDGCSKAKVARGLVHSPVVPPKPTSHEAESEPEIRLSRLSLRTLVLK